MTAPLSGQFDQEAYQAVGPGGSVRNNIAPRGVINLPQDGPVYAGRAGVMWSQMPALIAGDSGYGSLSTQTGVPMGTPDVEYEQKVGGGPNTAQVPDYGGTNY
jgi:hypothetical protein